MSYEIFFKFPKIYVCNSLVMQCFLVDLSLVFSTEPAKGHGKLYFLDELLDELRDELFNELCNELFDEIFDELFDELCDKLCDELCDKLCDELFLRVI